MKVNWTAAAVIIPLAATIIGYFVSIEVRLSSTKRIENIENSIRPLLIDYEVKQELVRLGVITENTPPIAIPEHSHPEEPVAEHVHEEPVPEPEEILAPPMMAPPPPIFGLAPGDGQEEFGKAKNIDWNGIRSQATQRADDQIQAYKNVAD